MRDQLEAKIEEHTAAIAQAKQMLAGFQEQAQGLLTDIVRREGAIMSLREILGGMPAPIAAVSEEAAPVA